MVDNLLSLEISSSDRREILSGQVMVWNRAQTSLFSLYVRVWYHSRRNVVYASMDASIAIYT
jgi:hypothetical protein